MKTAATGNRRWSVTIVAIALGVGGCGRPVGSPVSTTASTPADAPEPAVVVTPVMAATTGTAAGSNAPPAPAAVSATTTVAFPDIGEELSEFDDLGPLLDEVDLLLGDYLQGEDS